VQNDVGGDELKEKIDFIKNSITVLKEEDYNLITSYCFENQPMKKIMIQQNVTRNIIYYRLKRIARLIGKAYMLGKIQKLVQK
jgi:sugar diacid utilization regulator